MTEPTFFTGRRRGETEAAHKRREQLAWLRDTDPAAFRREVDADRRAAFVAGIGEHPDQYAEILARHHAAERELARRQSIANGGPVSAPDDLLEPWQALDVAAALFSIEHAQATADPDPEGTLRAMRVADAEARLASAQADLEAAQSGPARPERVFAPVAPTVALGED